MFIDGNGLDATVSFRWANTNTDWNTVTTGWKTVASEGAGSTFT